LRHLGCDTQTPLTLQLSPWLQHLGPNHYPFVYLFANWWAWGSAPPVTLHKPWFPCGPVDLRFPLAFASQLHPPVFSVNATSR
jgi:hypothetical protein